MGATNLNRWIGVGLLGLSLYGALRLYSSLDPQPDPNTQLEAWPPFVTTDSYVHKHLHASVLGIIFAIFGTLALGAHLAGSHAWRMGMVAMVISILGTALFLTIVGVSTFSARNTGWPSMTKLSPVDGR